MKHDEMVKLHAKEHEIVNTDKFHSIEEFLLYLIHQVPYTYASKLATDKTILDLGCNMGYGSEIMAKTAKRVLGADVCEKAIGVAKSTCNKNNIDFHLIDGKTLPFDDDCIDLVTSCQVIEHIVDYSAYIGELKRCLIPTGTSIFTTPNATLRLESGMKPWNEFHHHEFTAAELKELLKKHFKHVTILGLYAQDDLYTIEANRAARARKFVQGVEQSLTGKIIGKIKLALPTSVVYFLKALLNPGQKDQIDNFAREHNLSEFWYEELTENDKEHPALDLLAVCSDDEKRFQKAMETYLAPIC